MNKIRLNFKIMKKVFIFLIAIAFISMAAKAYASENSNFSGLYVGGNIGSVDTNMGNANAGVAQAAANSLGTSVSSSGLSSFKTAFAFDLNAGYNYKFKNTPIILGVGVIYINNGKITANGTLSYQGASYSQSISYDSYSYGAYLEPGIVLQNRFLLYGRIGLTHNNVGNYSYTFLGHSTNGSGGDGNSVYYGLGVQYLITKNVAFNLEYDGLSQSISNIMAGTKFRTHMHNNDLLVGISYYFDNI